MRRFRFILFFSFLFFISSDVFGQDVYTQEQLAKADISYALYNLKKGQFVLEKNVDRWFVPASILKVHTIKTALDVLGKDFSFQTEIFLDGKISDYTLDGNIVIKGYGDPTLNGSLDGAVSKEKIVERILSVLHEKNIHCINGKFIVDASFYDLPGHTYQSNYQDVANYYGAGVFGLNWRDNTYEIDLMRSGSKVSLNKINNDFIDDAKVYVFAEGSRDLAYIYPGVEENDIVIAGSVPKGQGKFTIKGSLRNPPLEAGSELLEALEEKGIFVNGGTEVVWKTRNYNIIEETKKILYSPRITEIGKKVLFKSDNLYAESFYKYLQKKGHKEKVNGRIVDGSGLSPVNRITARDIIHDLEAIYKSKNFDEFKSLLPANGKEGTVKNVLKEKPGVFHLKSGSMTGVNTYAGYYKSKAGDDMALVILVNNFNGSYSTGKQLCMPFLKFVAQQ